MLEIGVQIENDPDTIEESKEINMEVGIEDYLNIKMHFPSNTYLLNDVIHGQVLFSQIKLLIKKMDLNIVRKEILGSGVNSSTESTEVNSFEIMDGCPIKGKFEVCLMEKKRKFPSECIWQELRI